MRELQTWGQCDARTAQGWCYRSGFGFIAHWDGARDGMPRISYAFSVMDDYGELVEVDRPPDEWLLQSKVAQQ